MLYLLHFDEKIHHAQHYLGYSRDRRTLEERIELHRRGQSGARLPQVFAERGIPFRVARLWPRGTRRLERRLKNRKEAPRLCPLCQKEG